MMHQHDLGWTRTGMEFEAAATLSPWALWPPLARLGSPSIGRDAGEA